jgi:hypothetical protein
VPGIIAGSARERSKQAAHDPTTGEVLPSDGSVHPGNARQFAAHAQPARAAAKGISERTQRKLDKVAQLRPELLDEIAAGRLSAHAAAVKVGAAKDPTPFDLLVRAWNRASPAERDAFEDWIARERRKEAA